MRLMQYGYCEYQCKFALSVVLSNLRFFFLRNDNSFSNNCSTDYNSLCYNGISYNDPWSNHHPSN